MLLFFQFISAVEFNVKSSYSQGETIITKVSGNFLTPIAKENVFFYREHVRVPVDYGIAKIDEDYYIYALLVGKSEGNYSISIKDVKYMRGAEVAEDDIVRNFTITKETASFSLNPGFYVASERFYVEVQNLEDNQITVNVKASTVNTSARDILVSSEGTTAKETQISVKSGEIKRIYFNLGDGNPSLEFVELKSGNLTYRLPVYILTSSQTTEEEFKLEPSELILSIPTKSATQRSVYLYNTGNREITNISFSLSEEIKPFVNLSDSHIDKLEAKSNYPIGLSFFSPEEIEISGILKTNINGEYMLYSHISLKFLDDYVSVNESESSSVKTCSELGGRICSSNEKCSQQTLYAKDNVCCLGVCEQTKKKSSAGIIIAILIIFILLVLGVWFYKKKYKRAKKPVDLLKEAKGKKLVAFWARK